MLKLERFFHIISHYFYAYPRCILPPHQSWRQNWTSSCRALEHAEFTELIGCLLASASCCCAWQIPGRARESHIPTGQPALGSWDRFPGTGCSHRLASVPSHVWCSQVQREVLAAQSPLHCPRRLAAHVRGCVQTALRSWPGLRAGWAQPAWKQDLPQPSWESQDAGSKHLAAEAQLHRLQLTASTAHPEVLLLTAASVESCHRFYAQLEYFLRFNTEKKKIPSFLFGPIKYRDCFFFSPFFSFLREIKSFLVQRRKIPCTEGELLLSRVM